MRLRRVTGNPNPSRFLRNGFGTTIKPTEFRVVDYSEINFDKYTGQIDFLKGSSIDEATFTIIFNEHEKTQAHQAYNEIANLLNGQYRWQPNNTDDGAVIVGYRKEVTLSLSDLGGIVLTVRVVGFQSASLANVRKTPYIAARGGDALITVFVDPTTGYQLQTSLFETGPWETVVANRDSGMANAYVHSPLPAGSTHYYRARLHTTGDNENPWSPVISAKVNT